MAEWEHGRVTGASSSAAVGSSDRPDVLVAGYASVDLVFHANAPPAVGRTALLHGAATPSPRFGGCGPTAARVLARLGCRPALVTWLGDDADGRAYRHDLAADGVDTRAVVVAPGHASPRCYLFYDPAGGATLYYHPSASATLTLGDEARALLPIVRALVLTVVPTPLTAALLDSRRPATRLAWSVKADPAAYPSALRHRLIGEADLVCLNRDELPFVASSLPDPPPAEDQTAAIAALRRAGSGVVVVTAGAAGCRVVWSGGDVMIPAETVAVSDPTGAGDTFFAAFVAGWLGGADPPAAARTATTYVASMLRTRAAEEETR